MAYEYTDSPVHGKILSQQGKILILPRQQAQQVAEQYNGNLVKSHNNRFMIALNECGGDVDCGCGCNSDSNYEPGIHPDTYNQYPDHEVQMARQELYRTAKLALMLHDLLKNVGEGQGLEGWVQSKLTRAADYIETVFSYIDYEMRFPSGMTEAGPTDQSTIAPGQTLAGPNNLATANNIPGTTTNKVVTRTPGMVKMAKIDTNGNVQGIPIMVPVASVKSKQQAGFHVIGESASAGASAGASSAGSIGSVASVATGMGAMRKRKKDTGSLFGGNFKQAKVKEDWETLKPGERFGLANPRILTVGDDPQGIYDFAVTGNNVLSIRPFNVNQWNNHQYHARNKGYMLKYIGKDPKKAAIAHAGETPRTGYNMAGEKLPEGLKDPKDNPCWKGYHPVGTKKKAGRTVPNCVPNESVEESEPGVAANPYLRRIILRNIEEVKHFVKTGELDQTGDLFYQMYEYYANEIPGHIRQNPRKLARTLTAKIAPMLKYYGNQTLMNGQGVVENRFDKPLDGWHIVSRSTGNPVRPQPSFKTKEQAQEYLMTKMFANHQDYKVAHVSKASVKETEGQTGPKFTGYWKGTDKGNPGKKMVGGGP